MATGYRPADWPPTFLRPGTNRPAAPPEWLQMPAPQPQPEPVPRLRSAGISPSFPQAAPAQQTGRHTDGIETESPLPNPRDVDKNGLPVNLPRYDYTEYAC